MIELEDGERTELSGFDPHTTNQRMEITAAIEALEYLVWEEGNIMIYSDSAYVVNCMRRGWIKTWEGNGWKTYAGNAVANRDLWERLAHFATMVEQSGNTIQWLKVKGHANDINNNRADYLAVAAKRRGR